MSGWSNVLKEKRPLEGEITLIEPLGSSNQSGAGAFLGLANNNLKYWIKTLNNKQGPKIPITEQIIGRIGKIIKAPTCDVKTVNLPNSIEEYELYSENFLQPGIAHGSLAISNNKSVFHLEHKNRGSNNLIYCYFYALYDLCWGANPHWLISLNDDFNYYSHDHGFYLPPSGPNWNISAIQYCLDEAHELPDKRHRFDQETIEKVVSCLFNITKESLIDALSAIPRSWPVTDHELEEVGLFIERRIPGVVKRLKNRVGSKWKSF